MNKYLSIDCILSFIHIFFAKVEYFSCFVYNYFFLAEIFLVFYNVFLFLYKYIPALCSSQTLYLQKQQKTALKIKK